MKAQSFIESLCILYLLYHDRLATKDGVLIYILFIITKPSTTKWAYTDSSTLTYSIIRHTMRGYFAKQGNKPCSSCILILLLFWRENATMLFLPLLSSIVACSSEQQLHACFCFRSTSERSAGQIILYKTVF